MKKNELIAAVAAELKNNTELAPKIATKKTVEAVLESLTNVAYTALKDGDDLTIPGIVKIGTKVRPGRSGVLAFGDHAGEEWTSEDKTVPDIKPTKALKDAVA